jgi:hypothetical protein
MNKVTMKQTYPTRDMVILNPEWETELEWIVSENITDPESDEVLVPKGAMVTDAMLMFLQGKGYYSIKVKPMAM